MTTKLNIHRAKVKLPRGWDTAVQLHPEACAHLDVCSDSSVPIYHPFFSVLFEIFRIHMDVASFVGSSVIPGLGVYSCP